VPVQSLTRLWQAYVDGLLHRRQLAENSIRSYQSGWDSFIWTGRTLGWRLRVTRDITPERIEEWQALLQQRRRKDQTRRTYLMAVKGSTRWMVDNGHTTRDPTASFITPRLKRIVPLLPPFEELESAMLAEPSPRDRAILVPSHCTEACGHRKSAA
jgi:site-specific recombinase XerD